MLEGYTGFRGICRPGERADHLNDNGKFVDKNNQRPREFETRAIQHFGEDGEEEPDWVTIVGFDPTRWLDSVKQPAENSNV